CLGRSVCLGAFELLLALHLGALAQRLLPGCQPFQLQLQFSMIRKGSLPLLARAVALILKGFEGPLGFLVVRVCLAEVIRPPLDQQADILAVLAEKALDTSQRRLEVAKLVAVGLKAAEGL